MYASLGLNELTTTPGCSKWNFYMFEAWIFSWNIMNGIYIEGILPKGPYPPCLRMADRALLAGYPRYESVTFVYNIQDMFDLM